MIHSSIALLACAVIAPALAQSTREYPQRPIRVVIPYAPGGGSDILARFLAPRIAVDLGQQIVIDNRPGGSAMIGTHIMARAAPDGYTLGVIDSAFMINPALYKKMSYDALKDFAPITLFASSPLLLVVHQSVPANSTSELIALAKSRAGKLTFSSAGNGTAIHLALEQFRLAAGIDTIHVPYKGGGPSVAELVAGHVAYSLASPASLAPFMKAGRVRVLATTSPTRLATFPDVPLLAEQGLGAVNSNPCWGMVAPAGTAPDIVKRLHAVIVRHLNAPDLKPRLAELDFEVVGNTPEEFSAFIRAEIPKFAKLVRDAGVKVE
ncbi:MAG TPA: tripartite tricarboxylate transporter substrate binding protein [Burkholderiales bacterium]